MLKFRSSHLPPVPAVYEPGEAPQVAVIERINDANAAADALRAYRGETLSWEGGQEERHRVGRRLALVRWGARSGYVYDEWGQDA